MALSNTTTLYAFTGLCAYALHCSLLRYRNRNKILAEWNHRSKFAAMTTTDAWKIQKVITAQEFPFTAEKAFQFALFRYSSQKCHYL